MHLRLGAMLAVSFFFTNPARADFVLTQIERSDSLLPFLVGGAPADPALWPATLIFKTPARCTATIVGPKAILTAAHCLNGSTTGTAVVNGQTLSLVCKSNPSYSNDTTADIAMYQTSAKLTAPNLKYEVLNNSETLVKVNDIVVLLGFGCTTNGGGASDILYVGSATVKKLPLNFQRYEVEGGAQLCAGDSGGAGYRALDNSKRVVFSVNESRASGTNQSYLVSTTTSDNLTFIKSWSISTNNKLCGLDAGVSGCRH